MSQLVKFISKIYKYQTKVFKLINLDPKSSELIKNKLKSFEYKL